MNKHLNRSPHPRRSSALQFGGRLVALLLVPVLVADPVTAAALSPNPSFHRSVVAGQNLPRFREEAFAARVLSLRVLFHHPTNLTLAEKLGIRGTGTVRIERDGGAVNVNQVLKAVNTFIHVPPDFY